MTSRLGIVSTVAAGTVGLFITAYLMIMTTFMIYDDEGFVLMTLRQFLDGQPLYTSVFSQYGPTPYLYHWLVTLAGSIELTHMFGRWLTALHWMTCAICTGWIASRLVDQARFFVGCLAALFAFNLLWQMVAEPTHPGSLIAALLAVSTALGIRALESNKPHRLAVIVGACGALLVLTKINVGLFFIAATGAFALWQSAWSPRWQKPAQILAGGGLTILPLLLMAGNLNDPRILIFALKASLTGAGIWWVWGKSGAAPALPPRVWWIAGGTFVTVVAGVVGFVILRGSDIGDVLAAVVLDPLRQPGNFTVPPRSTALSGYFSISVVALAGWAGWQLRQQGILGNRCRNMVRIARWLTALGVVLYANRWASPWGAFALLDFALPALLLWIIPCRQGRSRPSPSLIWGTLIAGLQVLHAYPVAGSQIGWGCFLVVALFAASCGDELFGGALKFPAIVGRLAAGILLIAGSIGTISLASTGWHRYITSSPLPFAGADDIRLSDRTRIALSVLVQNAMVHSDVLFSRQGMYSFNIWSDTPTPSSRNATHWFWLLDEAEQREIIAQLSATSRAGFIVCEPLDDLLDRLNVPVAGPLQDFVETSFKPILRAAGFTFRVPHNSEAQAMGIASVLVPPDSPQTGRIILPAILAGTPATWEVREFDANGGLCESELTLLNPMLSPARANGDVMGGPVPLSQCAETAGLYIITADTDPRVSAHNYLGKAWAIRDQAGVLLAEGLFVE